MKIVVYGAGGRVGRRIVSEAAARGHRVLGVVKEPTEIPGADEVVVGDVRDPASVAQLARGSDAVVVAISSGFPSGKAASFDVYPQAVRALAQAARSLGAEAPRIVMVGGAASLLIAPGIRAVDTPEFPDTVKPEALAHAAALEEWRRVDDIDWTYISPAGTFEPGIKTGKYRRGGDEMLFDDAGESRISMEDYAVALVDELDHPQTSRARITFAY